MILAIDPGNIESGYVVIDKKTLKPIYAAKMKNDDVLKMIKSDTFYVEYVAIEMVASYGMAVGATVFETCVWIGRFYEAIKENLDIDTVLKDFNGEMGEIRPLIEWFEEL